MSRFKFGCPAELVNSFHFFVVTTYSLQKINKIKKYFRSLYIYILYGIIPPRSRHVRLGGLYELEFCSVEIYPDLEMHFFLSNKEDFIGVRRERGGRPRGPSYVDWSKILSPNAVHE
mgnify:CR=1 FL=1